ncbi:Isoleucine--tRNA ligase, mitochondrial, partial [Halocaridina rubra]
ECRVDDNGRYDATTGPDLQGKSVLSEGNDIVLQLLSKPDGPGAQSVVLNKGTFIHSYPYDWRTKEPVLIRASKQWFIDTERLKAKALEALRNVQILPSDVKSGMVGMLKKRPYWCISRQRVWGCPIPVFYDAEYGTPIISREIIERVAEIVRLRGADSWWELPETELLPSNFVEKCKQEGKRLPQKGSDILDIWFDSGSSWHCVLGGPSADLYLEGIDQFTGWFQSSLLTSVAVNAKAPY